MPAARRTAIVTGSSRGIGRAIAMRLLRSGYNVVLNYSTEGNGAEDTLMQCRQISRHVLMVKADVSKATEAANLVVHAVSEFGALDVLINNAATVADGPMLDMSEDDWDRVIDVNMKGAFLCSQSAARQMLSQDSGGVILNIGALTGIRARRDGINTCASKAGLMMMTQCLALELSPKIRVNTIIPGLTLTEETEHRFGLSDPSTRNRRTEAIPLGRIGQPDDVADAVMLMLSAESRFITGQKIIVDGGQYMF
jgi:NAD(P)-dependent dehydrogenase (short-subunit alcohol dehydrogenase family)